MISDQNICSLEDDKGNAVELNKEDKVKRDKKDNSNMELVEATLNARQRVPILN